MIDKKAFDILLVEDNPSDVYLIRKALDEGSFEYNLHVMKDAESAINFLLKKGEYKDAVTPDIIFVEIELPRMSGTELTSLIKEDEGLKVIPIIVLALSEQPEHVVEAYKCHANDYVVKPYSFDRFKEVVHKLQDVWMGITKLPTRVGK